MSPQIPAGIPPPLRNVTAAFGKISPIEKGETVRLFQQRILVQSWHLVFDSNSITCFVIEQELTYTTYRDDKI